MPAAIQSIDARQASRGRRFLDRWRLRRFTNLQRVAGCGRWLNGSADGLVTVRATGEVAHFSGLQTCGSVWACPACSAKIRQARADELEEAVADWLTRGGGVEFLTLTTPHTMDDDLEPLLDRVSKGWRMGITSTVLWRTLRMAFGIRAYCRTIEVTSGAHGWHPHIHALLFTRRPLDGRARARLGDQLFSMWSAWVARNGGGVCSREAFRLVGGEAGAGAYIVKVQDKAGQVKRLGMEMTRGDLKRGRVGSHTPFELIEAAADGEAWALTRWWEYEAATKGRRCLTWSKGGRALLGLDADEPTDEELAAEEVGGEIVLVLTADQWADIVNVPGGDAEFLCDVELRLGAGP